MSQQPPKEGKLSSSTIVDLKNELFRKRNEFEYQKLSSSSAQVTTKKLHEILKQGGEDFKKPPQNNVNRKKSPEPEPGEAGPDSEALSKSRAALERKAALYERLAKGEVEAPDAISDDEEGYLVDFDRKMISERHDPPRRDASPPPSRRAERLNEDDWADYLDNRGVKRRCLKSDLAELRDQQKRIRTEDQLAAISQRSDLLSRDDMRELERQRWEAKARNAIEDSGDEAEAEDESFFQPREPVGPLHYAHIAGNDTRVHGVGYFAFSAEETERQQQMEALKKLHDQTADQRRRAAGVKASREAMKNARLAKVIERRRQQGDLAEVEKPTAADSLDHLVTAGRTSLAEVASTSAEVHVPTPTTAPSESTSSAVKSASSASKLSWPGQDQMRDWDRGKNVPSAAGAWQRVVDERRRERPSEFAPPSAYRK